jgi:predicted ATPase
VLLSGEPGIGKSRLIEAVLDTIETEPHSRLRYFSSPYHKDSALHPVIAQLERAAGFERDDTAEIKLAKLEKLLAPGAPSTEDLALIAELLSLPVTRRYPPLGFTPQRKKEKTFAALFRGIEAMARRRPVLMAYEDLHWIDPTSLELLDLIIERVRQLPVFLIATLRPEFQAPPWINRPRLTRVALIRLDQAAGTALVHSISGARALPTRIVDEIVERTDGVPLFVEELTKAVVEANVHGYVDPNLLGTAGLAALAVPTTLHASLTARLDRLGPVAKEVTLIGAAIGREFSYELLAYIADLPEADLRSACNQLTTAGLVFGGGTGSEVNYVFKHALIRDAAYGTLLRDRRRELHAAIARGLEARFPQGVEAQPELLAHHLTEAGQANVAVKYWLKAGRRSAERSANREAASQLQRGLEMLMSLPASPDRDRLELDFQLALGTPLISLHGWSAPPVTVTYERAAQLCKQLHDLDPLGPTLFGLFTNRMVRGETRAARQLAEQLRALAGSQGNAVNRILSHRAMAAALMQLGELAQARSELENVIALYDPQRDRYLATRCITHPHASGLAFLSLVLCVMGYPEQAKRWAQDALRYAAELEHANTTGLVCFYAGAGLAALIGDAAAAGDYADMLIRLADEHHVPPWRGPGLVFRGWALAQRGDHEQGLSLAQQGIAEMDAFTNVFHRSRHLGLLAMMHARLHDRTAAFQTIEEAHEEVRRTEACFWQAELHRIDGEIRRFYGAPDAEVEACLAKAMSVARKQGARLFELRASRRLAELWRDQGRREAAREFFVPIFAWFTEGFDTPDLKEAKALLDELNN